MLTPPHLVVEVAQAAVALRGPVELCDLRDVEASHELLPYGLAQAVAQRHAHAVASLRVSDGLVQKVPADLPDVLHNLEETGRRDSGSGAQQRGTVRAAVARTVQLYLTQSSQKREAENFFLMTTVMP